MSLVKNKRGVVEGAILLGAILLMLFGMNILADNLSSSPLFSRITGFATYSGEQEFDVTSTNASLRIWDDTDEIQTSRDEVVNFYANFTNTTLNTSISNANCNISLAVSFHNINKVMTYNVTSELYEYSGSLSNETYSPYDINCTVEINSVNYSIKLTDYVNITDITNPIKPIILEYNEAQTYVVDQSPTNVYGYIGEAILINAYRDSGSYPTFTEDSHHNSSQIGSCTVVEQKNEQRVEVDCDTISIGDWVEFDSHQSNYLKRYYVNYIQSVGGGNQHINFSTNLTSSVSALDTVNYYTGEFPSGWFNISITLEEGNNDLSIWGTDNSSNSGSTYDFTLNYVPPPTPLPTLELKSPANDSTFVNIPNVNITINTTSYQDNNLSCEFFLGYNQGGLLLNQSNNTVWNSTETIFPLYNLSLGNYSWQINCTDNVGTAEGEIRTFEVIDTGSPVINLSAIQDPTFDNTPTLDFTLTDLTGVNSSLIQVNISNSTINSSYNTTYVGFSCSPITGIAVGCSLTTDYFDDGFYNLTFYAVDLLDNVTIETIFNYQIDSSSPIILGVDDSLEENINGNVFSNIESPSGQIKENISAFVKGQDNETGIAYFNYSIGTEQDMTALVGWTRINVTYNGINYTANITTNSSLLFRDEVMYYVNVYAVNNASSQSSVTSSDGILFDDNTEPTTPNVVDSGVFTTNDTVLYFNWSAIDPEADIAYYEVMLGNITHNNSVFDWTFVGLDTEREFENGFQEGQNYSLYVRAMSKSGKLSSSNNSDGIVVDISDPTGGFINYSIGYLTSNLTRVNVTVGADSVSGISAAWINTSEGDLINGTCSNEYLSINSVPVNLTRNYENITVTSGRCYKFRLTVENGAGLTSTYYDGNKIMRIDTTEPTMYSALDDGDSFSTHAINATLVATDDESGISKFNYSITKAARFGLPGTSIIYPWTVVNVSDKKVSINESALTGGNFTNGQIYFFNVFAENNAGLWTLISNSSDGIVWFDEEAPITIILNVSGDNDSDNDGVYVDYNLSDGWTDILIAGEPGKDDGMTCKYYDQDVHYQQAGSSYCSIVEGVGNDHIRNCSVQTYAEGRYTTYISCKDEFNNQQTEDDNLNVTWAVEGSGPVITITQPQENDTLGHEILISVQAIDIGISTIEFVSYNITNETGEIQSGNLTNTGGSTYATVWDSDEDGVDLYSNFTLFFWGRDILGYNSSVYNVTFFVDNDNITIQIISPEENVTYGDDFNLNITVQDDGTIDNSYWEIKDSSSFVVLENSTLDIDSSIFRWNDSINITGIADGDYEILVYAEDSVGNTKTKNTSFKIDNTAPYYFGANPSIVSNYTTIYNNESVTLIISWLDVLNNVSDVVFNHSAGGAYVEVGYSGVDDYVYNYTISSILLDTNETVMWQSCANDTIENRVCSEWFSFKVENRGLNANDSANLTINFYEDTNLLINLTHYFSDIDGNSINFTITKTANIVTLLNETSDILDILATGNWSGTGKMNITAGDIYGEVSSMLMFNITVDAVDDAPYIIGIMPNVTMAEESFNDSLNCYDYFEDIDSIVPQLDCDPVAVPTNLTVTVDGSSGDINISAALNWVGLSNITFAVTDNTNEINQTITVNVTNVNDAPEFVIVTVENDDTEVLSVFLKDINATDIEGDTLTYYNISGLPGTMTLNSTSGLLNWSVGPTDQGSYNISIGVNDTSGDYDNATFTLLVNSLSENYLTINEPITITPEVAYLNETVNISINFSTRTSIDFINMTITDPTSAVYNFNKTNFTGGMSGQILDGIIFTIFNKTEPLGQYNISLYMNNTAATYDSAISRFDVEQKKNQIITIS